MVINHLSANMLAQRQLLAANGGVCFMKVIMSELKQRLKYVFIMFTMDEIFIYFVNTIVYEYSYSIKTCVSRILKVLTVLDGSCPEVTGLHQLSTRGKYRYLTVKRPALQIEVTLLSC